MQNEHLNGTEFDSGSLITFAAFQFTTKMPHNIETYLRNLQTTDAVRADAWDAIHASDPADIEQRLRGVKGLTDATKAKLWDLPLPHHRRGSGDSCRSLRCQPADTRDRSRTWIERHRTGRPVHRTAHIDDLLRQAEAASGGRDVPRPLEDPDVQALITPPTSAAKVGKAAEQIAEFAIPGGSAAKATKGLSVLSRAGAQAATAGAVATAQTTDPNHAAVPAVVAGAMPIAGAASREVAKRIMGRALELRP